jgi:hypothetical protein
VQTPFNVGLAEFSLLRHGNSIYQRAPEGETANGLENANPEKRWV